MKTGKIFYGWVIVLAGMLITAAGIGVLNSTNSVFVKPICDSLGFSRGEFTMHRTIMTLVGAFLMPLYGRMIQRVGVKKILLICSLTLGAITACYSFATELWHFYLIAFINGAFYNGTSFIVVGTLVSQWFHEKKGFATGLAYCGSGIGSAIMVPIVGRLVEVISWRWIYRGIGALTVIILIPTILILVKETPESAGLRPYGETDSSGESASGPVNRGLALHETIRTPTFWMMIVSFFLIAMLAGGPSTHTVPYLTDIGYTTVFAAAVFSFVMVLLTVGKILLGSIFDRFGALAGSVFVGVCCTAFPIFALFASMSPMPWIYAVFLGLASSGFSVPVAVLITKYFGARDFPTIFSLCSMTTTFGSAVSIPLMGAIYDFTGSYHVAWILLAVFGGLSLLGLVGANLSSRKHAKLLEPSQPF